MPVITRFPQAYIIIDGAWNNPTNGYADDGAYLDVDGVRNTSYYVHFSDFGFTIPAGSTINSITYETEYKVSSTASAATIYLGARYDDSTITTFSTTGEPLTDTLFQGNVSPYALSVEQLNSSLLKAVIGVRMTGNKACNYMFDYVSVTVDYTEPSNDRTGTVAITASGAVAVNGKRAASSTAEVTNASAAEATGKKNSAGVVSFMATGTVTVEGQQTISISGSVSITATSGIETAAQATRIGVAGIITASNVEAAGRSARAGAADITVAPNVTAESKKTTTGQTDITGATDAEASGRKDTTSQTEIEALATPAADGIKSANGAISITSASTVTVYGTSTLGPIDKSGVVEITAEATVNVTGTRSATGSASLCAASQASTTGTKNAQVNPSIESAASLALTSEKAVDGSVEIAITGSVTVTGDRQTNLADPTVETELIEYRVLIYLDEIRPELAIIDYELNLTVSEYQLALTSEDYPPITEVIGVPYIGATVRLNATFPAEAGDLGGLTNVKCTITDSDRTVIDTIDGEDIQVGSIGGQYFTYYNIPASGVGDLSFAWSGQLEGDLILLSRKALGRVWQE